MRQDGRGRELWDAHKVNTLSLNTQEAEEKSGGGRSKQRL